MKLADHDPHCFFNPNDEAMLLMKLHHLIDWKAEVFIIVKTTLKVFSVHLLEHVLSLG